MTQILPYIIGAVIGIVIGGVAGALLGWNRRKSTAEREIGSAEEEATRIVNEAYGTSIGGLIKSARIKRAKELLKNSAIYQEVYDSQQKGGTDDAGTK